MRIVAARVVDHHDVIDVCRDRRERPFDQFGFVVGWDHDGDALAPVHGAIRP
jgi:hypothetical protein